MGKIVGITSQNRSIKILLILTGCFFVLLPLLFASSILPGFDVHVSRLYVLTLFLFFVGVCLYQGELLLPRGSIAFLGGGFLMWIFFSLFYSDVPFWTLRKILFIYSFVPLILVVYYLCAKGGIKAIQKLIKGIVIGALVASMVGIGQFCSQFIFGRDYIAAVWTKLTPFFLGGTFSESVSAYNSWYVHIAGIDVFRAIGFFPDPHVYAFYTAMILPFAFYLYKTTGGKKWLFFFWMILVGNILSLSRGGEVGLFFSLIMAIFLLWYTLSNRLKHFMIAVSIFVIIFFVIPQNPITERFLSSFEKNDNSNTARIEIWQETIAIWSEKPLLGTGLGAYSIAVDPRATYRVPIYAHNIFLDVLVEVGLVGLMLCVAMISRALYVFYRLHNAVGYSAIIGLSAFLAHGFFDTPIFSVHVLPIFLFFIALAIYYENFSTQSA